MSEVTSRSFTLTIRLPNGNKFDTTLVSDGTGNVAPETMTVLRLKDHLSALDETEKCPAQNQRLIYKGRILDNDRSLSDYGITDKCTVFLVKSSASTTASPKPPSSGVSASNTSVIAPATATMTAAATTTTTTAANPFAAMNRGSTSTNNAPQLQQAPIPFMFPRPGGSGGGSGMSSLSQFGPGEMNSDPSEVLNNPFVQNMLDSNPDFLRNMMRQQLENNPALQQLMDSNPAIRHMLNDPNQFDEMIRMMRNPAAMQQAMRSQDLALSQIENMPGGFAALSNMYETMQRPLEESFAEARTNRNSNNNNSPASNSNTASNNEGATGTAMPNPWGTPAPTWPRSNPNANMSNVGGSGTSGSHSNAQPGGMFAGNAVGPASGEGGRMNPINPFDMMMGGNSGGMFNRSGGLGQTPSLDERQATFNMLQSNPAMLNMMQQAIRQNPGMFRQMYMNQAGGDPMAAMMFQNMTDEQFADVLIQMMNPDTINRMMQMEQQLRGLNFGGAGAGAGTNPSGVPFNPWATNAASSTTAPPSTASIGGDLPALDFSSLLFGSAAASGVTPPAVMNNNLPPAERYQVQLRSLYEMGFDDEIRNIAALQAVHGNLNRAVDMLLSGTVPDSPAATTPTEVVAPASSSEQPGPSAPASGFTATTENTSGSDSDSAPCTEDQAQHLPPPPKDPSEKKND